MTKFRSRIGSKSSSIKEIISINYKTGSTLLMFLPALKKRTFSSLIKSKKGNKILKRESKNLKSKRKSKILKFQSLKET